MNFRPSSLELLEARIAPARLVGALPPLDGGSGGGNSAAPFSISVDGKTATYTDLDGDVVSITTSKGRFRSENFVRNTDPANDRVDLDLLDLTALNLGARFQGADITMRLVTNSGDGFADLAGIKARGIDLGRVIVRDGDLGQIDVGDANVATPAALLIQSDQYGFGGTGAQPAGQDTVSSIRGSVGTISVLEYKNAFIDVRGSIGSILLDSVQGTGETKDFTAAIRATGPIGTVVITGNITGGDGDYSGAIWSRARIGAIRVGASITGGAGFDSGAIFAGSPDNVNAPFAGRLGPAVIQGSLIGGNGANSGTLYADSGLLNVAVLGNVTGGAGAFSGSLVSGLGFANVRIVGDLVSGAGDNSGSIVAFAGNAPNITISGQIIANNFANSGIFINGSIGSLSIGSTAEAGQNATEIRARDGIGSMVVFGNLNDVFVRAGTNVDGFDVNANVVIGSVLIAGNFEGGGLSAGAAAGTDNILFNSDDIRISPDPLPRFFSRIDEVFVRGTFNPFSVQAERLGAIYIAGVLQNLTAGPGNDNITVGTALIRELR